MTDCIVVLITVPKEDEAVKIARAIVENRTAACVNVVKDIRSVYRWEGNIEDDNEALLIVKTRKDLFESLMKSVKDLHSYSVPEIIALPIVEGFEDYLKWVKEETGEKT